MVQASAKGLKSLPAADFRRGLADVRTLGQIFGQRETRHIQVTQAPKHNQCCLATMALPDQPWTAQLAEKLSPLW